MSSQSNGPPLTPETLAATLAARCFAAILKWGEAKLAYDCGAHATVGEAFHQICRLGACDDELFKLAEELKTERDQIVAALQGRTCATCRFAGPEENGDGLDAFGIVRECRHEGLRYRFDDEGLGQATTFRQPFGCTFHKPLPPAPPQAQEKT